MATKTMHLRHVWRTVNDGNQELKVLALQQWYEAEGWEHPDYVKVGGFWEDVEISLVEPDKGPHDTAPDAQGGEDAMYVIFDGPPSHEAPHFVEVEDSKGRSVSGPAKWEPYGKYFRLGPFYTAPITFNKNKYYVHYNGAAVFVKEAEFFLQQKKESPEWNTSAWYGPIEADGIEQARSKGQDMVQWMKACLG